MTIGGLILVVLLAAGIWKWWQNRHEIHKAIEGKKIHHGDRIVFSSKKQYEREFQELPFSEADIEELDGMFSSE